MTDYLVQKFTMIALLCIHGLFISDQVYLFRVAIVIGAPPGYQRKKVNRCEGNKGKWYVRNDS